MDSESVNVDKVKIVACDGKDRVYLYIYIYPPLHNQRTQDISKQNKNNNTSYNPIHS